MMQMVGAGELANVTEGRQMVANNFPLETYEPGNENGWDEAYEKFKKIAAESGCGFGFVDERGDLERETK